MSDYTMSTNAHHPAVKSVSRLSNGILSITLGGTGYAHVALLLTDGEWRQIVRDVDQRVARLGPRAFGAEKNEVVA
jgi:hypothetical protein